MKKMMVATALLLSSASIQAADVDSVVFNGFSHHFGDGSPDSSCLSYNGLKEYNEVNTGVAVSGTLDEIKESYEDLEIRWELGTFKNSCDLTSKYVMLEFEIGAGFGINLGLADNYPDHRSKNNNTDTTNQIIGGLTWSPDNSWKIKPEFLIGLNPSAGSSGAKALIAFRFKYIFGK